MQDIYASEGAFLPVYVFKLQRSKRKSFCYCIYLP